MCISYIIDFNIPFMKYTIPLFLIWTVGYSCSEKKGASAMLSIIRFIAIYFGLAILSLGSHLFPMVLFFLWWIVRLVDFSFLHSSRGATALWRNFNRFSLAAVAVLIVYGYAFEYNDPERLIFFAGYTGGPSGPASERVVMMGRPAVPLIMQRLVLDPAIPDFRRDIYERKAVWMIKEITGTDIARIDPGLTQRENLLKWWEGNKTEFTPKGAD